MPELTFENSATRKMTRQQLVDRLAAYENLRAAVQKEMFHTPGSHSWRKQHQRKCEALAALDRLDQEQP